MKDNRENSNTVLSLNNVLPGMKTDETNEQYTERRDENIIDLMDNREKETGITRKVFKNKYAKKVK